MTPKSDVMLSAKKPHTDLKPGESCPICQTSWLTPWGKCDPNWAKNLRERRKAKGSRDK